MRAPLARAALPLLAAYLPKAFRLRSACPRSARVLHVYARTTASHDDYCKVEVRDGADAGDLKKAVIAELKLNAAPNRVRLLREIEGGGAPVPLDSRRALADQGVHGGNSIVVEVTRDGSLAQQQPDQQVLAHLRRLQDTMNALTAAQTAAPVSTSQLGHTFSELLTRQGMVAHEPALAGAAAVLSAAQEEELRRVSASELEAGVVAFMTPILAQYVQEAWGTAGHASGSAPALVNSENLPWLQPPATPNSSAHCYKPDLFLTHLAFAELRMGGQKGRGQGRGYLFGRLAGEGALQREGCVAVVLEARVGSLTSSHFGELAAYHQALPGATFGLLFGPSQFWMYSSLHGLPLTLRKDAWVAEGSASRLRSFLAEAAAQPPPPLLLLLQRLLDDLSLEPLHLPSATASAASAGAQATSCYLGSGACGHVFAARPSGSSSSSSSSSQQPLALKVVLAPRKGARGADAAASSFAVQAYIDLEREFDTLCRLARAGAPVVHPLPGSLRDYSLLQGAATVAGGGYAMASVCAPVAVTSLLRCREVFCALAELHAHGVAHGDARLANLMELPEDGAAPPAAAQAPAPPRQRLAWIDVRSLRYSRGHSSALQTQVQEWQKQDALTLAKSVLGVAAEGGEPLPVRVQEAAQQWEASSASAVAALAEAVWEER